MKIFLRSFLALICISLMAGCSSIPSAASRQENAEKITQQQDWVAENINTGKFVLRSFRPAQLAATKILTIYIEGDGLAWVSSDMPSDDPTPVDPLALKLALAQPEGDAVYLARPCQFTGTDRCAQKYWTHARFSAEVVSAMNIAVDKLKIRFSVQEIQLVGYSGGGAVASLLAARRKDVSRLVTVAGNLDHATWTRLHRISPLTESLNPADEAFLLRKIPQLHLLGSKDQNIQPAIAQSFTQQGGIVSSSISIIEGYDHRCCWADNWPRIFFKRQ